MFNDRIGRVKDNLSRTVILLEFIDLGIGIIFFKIKDIADIRAAPPIDALVNIADGTKVVFRGTDEFGQKILHMVRILVFIDHDILELMLVFFPHVPVMLQQVHGKEQEVVKINGVVLTHALFVFKIDLGHFLGMEVIGLPGKSGTGKLCILGI